MTHRIRFNDELEKWLKDYIATNHKHISDYTYEITDGGKKVEFSGYMYKLNSDSAMAGIKVFEEKMPITFLEIVSSKNFFKFIYKFNDDADFDNLLVYE